MQDEHEAPPQRMIPLPVDSPIWPSFFTVAPLVIVGTVEPGGETRPEAQDYMGRPTPP